MKVDIREDMKSIWNMGTPARIAIQRQVDNAGAIPSCFLHISCVLGATIQSGKKTSKKSNVVTGSMCPMLLGFSDNVVGCRK